MGSAFGSRCRDRVTAAVALIGGMAVLFGDRAHAPIIRAGLYFLVVWIGLGVAPTLVAGYASPRHMYLASADGRWRSRPPWTFSGMRGRAGPL